MKILIVDDNPDDRRVLRYLVQKQGHQAAEAQNGVEGLEQAKADPPDLIISDALMPLMDGYQFLRAVKQDEKLRSIPFIFYTSSYQEDRDVRLAMSLGADAFFVKPVEPVELWAKIEGLLQAGRKEQGPAPPLVQEDVEYLKRYSEVVATKLEKKVQELEQTLQQQQRTEAALRRSEAGLQLALEAGQLGDWHWNIVTGKITWSARCKALYGLPPEEHVTYEGFLAAVHPDDRERTAAALKRAVETRADYELEKRVVWRDGSVHWATSRGRVFYDSAGQPLHMAGVTMDITERKQAEATREALLTLEARLSEASTPVEAARTIFAAADQLWDWDSGALDLYSAKEDRANSVLSVDIMEGQRREVPSAVVSGKPSPRMRHILKDGAELILRAPPIERPTDSVMFGDTGRPSATIMCVPLRQKGQPIGVLSVQSYTPNAFTRDDLRTLQGLADHWGGTLERIRATIALQESEARYRELIVNQGEGLGIVDPQERFTFANPAGEAIFGVPSGGLTGHTLREFTTEAEFARILAQTRKRRVGEKSTYEMEITRPDGETRCLLVSAVPQTDAAGQFTGTLGLFLDITERRKAEDERLEHLRLLESLDLVNRAIRGNTDPELMMSDVLDVVLSIFDCDRAFLMYPCDPEAASWRVPMERNKPKYPGVPPLGAELPMDADVAGTLRILLEHDGPVKFGPGTGHVIPTEVAERFGYKCFMSMALHPRLEKPWQFGIHQCSYARVWTPEEERLFLEIGRRLSDALTGLLAHRDLRASEERLRLTLEAAQIVAWEVNAVTGKHREAGPVGKVFGRGKEFTHPDIEDLANSIHLEDRERVRGALQAALRGEADYAVEYRILLPDGSVRWLAAHGDLERDREGRPARLLGIARDITALKRTEETLRKLSRAVEQSPASIVITDGAGTIEYVNPKFTKVTGYSQAEAVGQNPRILKSGEMPPEQYQQMWQTIASGKEWRGEFHNRKKNGELYWELASISPIFDAAGAITHYLAVKEDITEHKRLEDELRQAQKMEAFGQLAGGVAHDFNNVLAIIQGNAALFQMGGLSGQEQANALEQISGAVERAARLTRQLLMFSRRQVVQLKDLDLNEVVLNMTKMLQRLIGEHISLAAHYAPGGAPVHADPGMMEQVLMNLAVNSRDAMPKGGQLGIQTEILSVDENMARTNPKARPGRFVRLSVSDTGSGIAAEHLPHIFEPFFTTKDVGKGTGLGLATVFGIVEQHQGWIAVESQVGLGTVFRIYLPHLGKSASAKAERRTKERERGGTETILLVEDEAALRQIARKILERHGYQVYEATSAIAALSVWSEHREEIALVLTDIVMPEGMSGRELGKRLQAEKPALKVIYSSGYTDEMLGEASAWRGTPNFLEKPYGPVEVLRKVRACLDAG